MLKVKTYGLPQPWSTRYARHKAQAKYRNEPYQLSPADYYDLWLASGHSGEAGRKRGQYTMIRVDRGKPWEPGNISIISRAEHTRGELNRYWTRGFAV
jgi:hypothetical protein